MKLERSAKMRRLEWDTADVRFAIKLALINNLISFKLSAVMLIYCRKVVLFGLLNEVDLIPIEKSFRVSFF